MNSLYELRSGESTTSSTKHEETESGFFIPNLRDPSDTPTDLRKYLF